MSDLRAGRQWRRALVYGLGLSGVAAARFLRDHGVEVVAVDRRLGEELDIADLATDPGVELRLGEEPSRLPDRLDGVVVSPGVPADRPLLAAARRRGLPVVAEVELVFPWLNGPLLGITGSNGKSTTTALTGALLRGSGLAVEVCGNIGVPMSSRVAGPPGRIFVAELSSFQLEAVDRFRPQAAALLNLSADHLDRHGGFAGYSAAKRRLFRRQEATDVAVLNADDPLVATTEVCSRRRWFSRLGPVEDGCYLVGDRVMEAVPGERTRELFATDDLSIPGVHNLENAMAASLLALAAGARRETLRDGLSGFRGLPHRLQRVADIDGVSWYDDSKGTNVDATLKSLLGFAAGTVHLILGGRSKGADPRELAAVIESKVRRLYLIGEAAAEFARVLGGVVPIVNAETLEVAVRRAAAEARPGESVLLSPACASFDQYTSYIQRGEHFHRLVDELGGGGHGQEARL